MAPYWWLRFGGCPGEAYSSNIWEKKYNTFIKGVANDYRWVTLIIRNIMDRKQQREINEIIIIG